MEQLLATKKGMTHVFDAEGNALPVTVVEAGPCTVTQLKSLATDGYEAIQVMFGTTRREFPVAKSADFTVGQEIKADVFKPGDLLHVAGKTVGKGFAGTVKRHHFSRGPMAHGSKSHRLPGSIGAGTTPGRVFKGLRMGGRMGGKQATQKNLVVIQVNPELNVLLLKGTVPGKPGNLVVLRKTGVFKPKQISGGAKKEGKTAAKAAAQKK